MNERWVTISEISRVLGCCRLTVAKRVREGAIPGGRQILGRLRVERGPFYKWLKAQKISGWARGVS